MSPTGANGFPGDFRIVDRRCQGANTTCRGALGYSLEEYHLVRGGTTAWKEDSTQARRKRRNSQPPYSVRERL